MFAALKRGGFGQTGTAARPTDVLTSQTRDSLFLYQLQLADLAALKEESLLVAKICGMCSIGWYGFHFALCKCTTSTPSINTALTPMDSRNEKIRPQRFWLANQSRRR